MVPGIHLLHKPVGPSSFSLVQEFSRTQPPPAKKLCHGGTLDPFASGLLLILVQPATRLFDYLHKIPKVYEATVCWGAETDNGDPLGKVVFTGDAASLTPEGLEEALRGFIGWREQTPPPFSARRVGGERAYLKAHRGEAVEMPPTQIYLHEATWLSHDLPRCSRLRMTVRGGYYVRALARDIGRLLGCGAHLSELHRASIGPWNDPGPGQNSVLAGRDILPWAPSRILSDQDVGDLRKEKTIPLGELIEPDWKLPEGFPDAQSPIRGFHLEKFCFLLAPAEDATQLKLIAPLSGGL
jgi:tRNA pseudouridine55 synthase